MPNTTDTIQFADSHEHGRLPVIDLSHAAFAVQPDAAELDRLARAFVEENRERRDIPPHVRAALQRSRLGQGLMAAAGSYLSGMHTYLLKLGPDHLGDGYDQTDRRIADSFPAFMARVRLQDMVTLLADGLAAAAPADRGRPLRFINIAGGPAADSWNALIQLRARHPDALADRPCDITILDIDVHGPAFGARAVAALQAPGAPLHGLDLHLRHQPYAWTEADRLPSILADLGAREATCAISSEGGLFQYGSDADILANLTRLREATPADAFVAGSVTADDEPARVAQAQSRATTRPIDPDAFRRLAAAAGWTIDALINRPFAYTVRLVKAA
jgi:hypothetical protein